MRQRRLVCLLAAMAVTASGRTVRNGGSNIGGGGRAKIGLITKTDTNPHFVELSTAAAKAQGAEFIALADSAYVGAAFGGARPKLIMIDGTAGSTVDTYRHNGFLQGIGLAIADRIHVHRLGRRVAVVSPKTTSMNQVLGLITGALRMREDRTVEEVRSAMHTGLSA